MDELLEQFLIEGRELVQAASDDLLALERDPADAARIDSAFRAVHTLKGSVGLFDFAPMAKMLHTAEDVLSGVRAGSIVPARPVLDALLDCVGASDRWIEAIACAGALPADAETEGNGLSGALAACLGARNDTQAQAAPADTAWADALMRRARASGVLADGVLAAARYVPAADCFFLGDDPMALVRAIPELVFLHITPRAPWALANFDPYACNLRIEALSRAPLAAVRDIFRFVPDQCAIVQTGSAETVADEAAPPVAGQPGDAVRSSLRVDAARIDALGDIAGELVVAKNRLAHLLSTASLDAPLARALNANQADIERLVGDMQRAVMRTRMLPLAGAFRRLPRLVRDIAARAGKQVVFDITGEDVEVDKALVDGLFEPLLHILRNAVDHGIEDGAARRAAGKPGAGRLTLAATRAGEQIAIAVQDDGAGIDPAKIRRTAQARGVISAAAADALDDRAAAELIFTPGFSTAATPTELSGRGIGMDVVRNTVEALGGRVSLTSHVGTGTTIRLTLPQAVSITTAMTVCVGGERFGVPIDMVAETARIPAAAILPVRAGAAFVLRDRTIPLLRLADLLGLPAGPRPGADAKVLILAIDEQRVGVEVDSFAERADVLLRPMTGMLAAVPGVRGTALMGDGKLLMVLDLPELIG